MLHAPSAPEVAFTPLAETVTPAIFTFPENVAIMVLLLAL